MSEQIFKSAVLELQQPAHTLENRKPIATLELQTGIGIPARPGAANDKYMPYDQISPSATWVITHNLGKNPSVTVIDSGGSVVFGAITYNSLNQLTLEFSGAFAGSAYLN